MKEKYVKQMQRNKNFFSGLFFVGDGFCFVLFLRNKSFYKYKLRQ